MVGALHDFPKFYELHLGDFSIIIDIDLIKELLGGELAELSFPMLYGLLLVDTLAAINIKYLERLSHFKQ